MVKNDAGEVFGDPTLVFMILILFLLQLLNESFNICYCTN